MIETNMQNERAYTPPSDREPRGFWRCAHPAAMLLGWKKIQSSRLAIGTALTAFLFVGPAEAQPERAAPVVQSRAGSLLTVDGHRFRDLDRDGRLARYEDWRLPPEIRAKDILARMTLEEKAGTMMHSTLAGVGSIIGDSTGGYDFQSVAREIEQLAITSFITRLPVSPREMALQNNQVQEIAERSRLGIPVTISTDPRHHFQYVLGAASATVGVSQWPELLGFGALRDAALVQRFADIARRDYRAMGIHMALSPQADLFTEPRWSRGAGTFGADPAIARTLVGAYVQGFQGGAVGPTSDGVLTVVKHWVGYGAAPEGWDGHNHYGRFSNVDSQSLPLHIEPFLGAFDNAVAGVMPTYNILQGAVVNGKPVEQVGAGFSRQLLTELLRENYGFRGFILSDWGITRDCPEACSDPKEMQPPSMIAMPWGVETMSPLERYAKGIEAGLDQFGGVNEAAMIVEAVRRGLVNEKRIDESVERILVTKFQLGLFDNPFVDPDAAERLVGSSPDRMEALRAQAQSQVLLKNSASLLPLAPGTKVWLHSVDPAHAVAAGLVVVEQPDEADVAVVRTSTPFERPHPNHFFGSRQNEGRLDYRPGDADFDRVAGLHGKVPVIVAAFADRPPIMTLLEPMATAILLNFGVSDEALFAVITGKEVARGCLPFELPSTGQAVAEQDPALPDDSDRPLFAAGNCMRQSAG